METSATTGTEANGPALTIFALGHADASLSFIRLLPESARKDVETILALRLLSKLWNQYRVDSGINQGGTLLSANNGYELRVFSALIDVVSDWPPLRNANGLVRSLSPALSAYERQFYENELDDKRTLLLDIVDQIELLPADISLGRRASLLIDRWQRLDEIRDHGVCWGLNLAAAFGLLPLGASKVGVPFPALFSREMLRFDRSRSWRENALQGALAESAHSVSGMTLGSFSDRMAFEAQFAALRRNSRLRLAHLYLSGIGEISPALLARLVGCSAPGARKMLKQFELAGFATHHPPALTYVRFDRFRLARSSAVWLRSFSFAADASRLDRFDD